jgi:hypothetical protein
MDSYINHSYYDEVGKYIVVVHKNTPKETIERYKKKYDEVRVES